MSTPFDPPPPPRPRLGGPGPAIVGIVGFLGALFVFAVVLVVFDVLPNPMGEQTRPAAATVSPAPSELPKSARFAQQGDCVLNNGTEDQPDMVLILCGPGALEVIDRIEGTTDIEECTQFPAYKYHYFYDSELGDSFDFVLCMRKRP